MRVGNFSVLIPEGRERDSGHVELPHGTVYRIKLANHLHSRRCDALVSVDGKDLGGFRVDAGGSIVLETIPGDGGRFTFFRADSDEGRDAGAGSVARDDRGLVQVRFRPERSRQSGIVKTCGGIMPLNACDVSKGLSRGAAGVTGMTGHSDQRFVTVADLDYEPGEEVMISIRLVAGGAVRELRPAKQLANPVPAPAEG